jgi:hypothetical protein
MPARFFVPGTRCNPPLPYPGRELMNLLARARYAPIADVSLRGSETTLCANTESRRALFDHLVGACEKGRRNSEAKRLRSLQVDHEFEFGRLFDR